MDRRFITDKEPTKVIVVPDDASPMVERPHDNHCNRYILKPENDNSEGDIMFIIDDLEAGETFTMYVQASSLGCPTIYINNESHVILSESNSELKNTVIITDTDPLTFDVIREYIILKQSNPI